MCCFSPLTPVRPAFWIELIQCYEDVRIYKKEFIDTFSPKLESLREETSTLFTPFTCHVMGQAFTTVLRRRLKCKVPWIVTLPIVAMLEISRLFIGHSLSILQLECCFFGKGGEYPVAGTVRGTLDLIYKVLRWTFRWNSIQKPVLSMKFCVFIFQSIPVYNLENFVHISRESRGDFIYFLEITFLFETSQIPSGDVTLPKINA